MREDKPLPKLYQTADPSARTAANNDDLIGNSPEASPRLPPHRSCTSDNDDPNGFDHGSTFNASAALASEPGRQGLWAKIPRMPRHLFVSALVACLGSFNNGYNTSVFNIPEGVIRFCEGVTPPDNHHGAFPDCIPMDNFQWGITVALFAIGGLFGGLLGGPAITRLGRRWAMFWNNLFLIVGVILVATTTSIGQIVAGRFVVGIGCGGACVITPTYLSEISTVETRGALGTMNQLFIVIGILLTEAIGLGLSDPPYWRLLSGISALVAVAQMAGCFYIDESPKFLMLQGRKAEAERVLQRLRGSTNVQDELDQMVRAQWGDEPPTTTTTSLTPCLESDSDTSSSPDVTKDRAFKGQTTLTQTLTIQTEKENDDLGELRPNHCANADAKSDVAVSATGGGGGGRGRAHFQRQPDQAINIIQLLRNRKGSYNLARSLIIASVFTSVQQLSGINGVMFYSTSIFNRLFADQETPKLITVGTGVLNLVMTLATIPVVDRLGRKALTMTSSTGMTLASILIVVGSVANIDILVVVCVFLFIATFAVGLGVTPWLVMTEVFPTYAVSAASSWCMVLNWFSNFLVGVIFPSLQKGLGDYTFVPFAVITGVFSVFVFFFVPETKGKTPEEILGESALRSHSEEGGGPGDNAIQSMADASPRQLPSDTSDALAELDLLSLHPSTHGNATGAGRQGEGKHHPHLGEFADFVDHMADAAKPPASQIPPPVA
ncbi:Bifunctional purine biosynthesis protein PurH [Dimargaris verticillata]|uniref:Bifunctional purine biosynthesis protein PurH n=1 Tax=Dimargaris verticillata TaxID=2761393 RepID=A0A9W8B564_9FUNG|nr:Bifunctional purine biosynthesis protein PurH [Dimargaris verticillata]